MSDWNNIGGCGVLHPFNAIKRAECENKKLQLDTAKNQDDLLLAQAAYEKSQQPTNTGWSAGQTALVVGASLIGIALLVIVIKKFAKK